MKPSDNMGYVKRAQKDYSISLKPKAVQEIELGALNRTGACHKYNLLFGNGSGNMVTLIGRTNQQ